MSFLLDNKKNNIIDNMWEYVKNWIETALWNKEVT